MSSFVLNSYGLLIPVFADQICNQSSYTPRQVAVRVVVEVVMAGEGPSGQGPDSEILAVRGKIQGLRV